MYESSLEICRYFPSEIFGKERFATAVSSRVSPQSVVNCYFAFISDQLNDSGVVVIFVPNNKSSRRVSRRILLFPISLFENSTAHTTRKLEVG
jgi:hypothetical protein